MEIDGYDFFSLINTTGLLRLNEKIQVDRFAVRSKITSEIMPTLEQTFEQN